MTVSDASWDRWQSSLFDRVDGLVSRAVALDPETRRRAALVVVDDMAAMATALSQAQIQALSSAAMRIEPSPEASHITGGKSGRAWAAMVNAVAANWNELDEGYRPATCHGGLYALPAGMAEVEASHGTVGDLLVAVVASYEVSTGYARVIRPPRPLALHPHATLSPLGAAVAVAAARGEYGPGVRAASDIAVTLAAIGPFDHAVNGVLARNGWAGHGAMSGFTAVEMATAGVRADSDSALSVFHGGLGYPLDEEELRSEPGRWAIHDGYHKSYACCQYAHSAVEATLTLVEGTLAGVAVEEIASVVIATHPLAMALDDAAPRNVLGGKFSVPHAVAAVLARGNTDVETFSETYLDNTVVARLRGIIKLEPYQGDLQPPYDRPSRVTVTTTSGAVFIEECQSAIGGPDRPLSEADVLDKVSLLTVGSMPGFADTARDLVEGVIQDDLPWSDFLARAWTS